MKTVNELERDKKDKIRNLSPDEVERYIDNLNKNMAESWGNVDNGFNIDVEKMLKNDALCTEAVEILNDKYKMDLLVAISRNNALAEKHLADVEDMRNLILENSLDGFISTYWQTSHNMLILTQFLNLLYQYYWIPLYDIEDQVDIEKTPVYSLYQQHYMNSVEVNIKHMAGIIDAEMIILKQLTKFQFKKDATPTGTYHDTFRKDMIKYQELSQELIADYEELKKDGFKNAKEIEAEMMARTLDKDEDYWMDVFKDSRPSYDVNNFIFIPPQVHIESMEKYHPDWKDNGPIGNDEYDDEGLNVWYATVTNPIIK